MIGSLSGIRVVDLTTSVAGPFATQILGDLGADVIKVERPGGGDDARLWGPPFWNGESATFIALNRNKRSIVLDLKNPYQFQSFVALLETADIFVQNLRPGATSRLGLEYDALRSKNPGLIYCDISGYGRDGPLGGAPAYDTLVQAFSGLMSIAGEQGRPVVRIPVSILDQGVAMWTVIGVLDALRHRDRTGQGARLDTSLLGTALMWQPSQLVGYFSDGTVPERRGSGTVGIYPYAAFPTRDNYVVIAAANDALWRRLCAAIDREDLLEDSRFVSNPERVINREELYNELVRTLCGRDSAHWTDRIGAAGVPIAEVQSLDAVATHDQVKSLGAIAEVPHPRIEAFRLVNLPVQSSGEYPRIRLIPPMLGEHTDEILSELDNKDDRHAAGTGRSGNNRESD